MTEKKGRSDAVCTSIVSGAGEGTDVSMIMSAIQTLEAQ